MGIAFRGGKYGFMDMRSTGRTPAASLPLRLPTIIKIVLFLRRQILRGHKRHPNLAWMVHNRRRQLLSLGEGALEGATRLLIRLIPLHMLP